MIPIKVLGSIAVMSLAISPQRVNSTSSITFSDPDYLQRPRDTINVTNSNWGSNVTCFVNVSRAQYYDQNNNSTYFIFGLSFNLNIGTPNAKFIDYIEINLTANGNDRLRLKESSPSNAITNNDFFNLRSNLDVWLGYDYDSAGYSPRITPTFINNLGTIDDQVRTFTASQTGLSYKYQSDIYINSLFLSKTYCDSIVLVLESPGQVVDPLTTPSINGSILFELCEDGIFNDPLFPQTTSFHYSNI